MSIRYEKLLSIGHQYFDNFIYHLAESQFSVVVPKLHFFQVIDPIFLSDTLIRMHVGFG